MRAEPSILRCPRSGSRLEQQAQQFLSTGGRSYPILAEVPILVNDARVEPRNRHLSQATIKELRSALQLDADQTSTLARILSEEVRFEADWMQAEADQFLHRVAATNTDLREALAQDSPTGTTTLKQRFPTNEAPCLQLNSSLIPTSLEPEQAISFNLRVHNTGTCTLSAEGPTPVHLAYQWHLADGSTEEGLRTPLLIDIAPGSSLSMPILVKAPLLTGEHTLEILAVHENVAWLKETGISVPVSVGPHVGPQCPPWLQTNRERDYMEDHREGLRLLQRWCEVHLRQGKLRLAELGGNAHPMIAELTIPECQRFNIDIDPYGMAVGHNLIQPRNTGVQFIVADGYQLPFAKHSLDMIALFATFHHFPDPIGLLRQLKQHLRRGGLLCLMCEPIGHVDRHNMDSGYREELLKGVNEQSFMLWEYSWMIDQAGYEVVDAQVDIGSLKIAIKPRSLLQRLKRRLSDAESCHPPMWSGRILEA